MTTDKVYQDVRHFFGRTFALITSGLGILALWSWGAGVGHLFTFAAEHRPMAPSTALCLVLIGAALLLRERAYRSLVAARFGLAFAALVSIVGTLACIRLWFGWDSPVEEWLAQTSEHVGDNPVGQMRTLAGVLLLAAGAAYWLQSSSPNRRSARSRLATVFALVILLAGTGVAVSYAVGNPRLLGGTYFPMALWTAISFIFLGGALLADTGNLCQQTAKAAASPVQRALSKNPIPALIAGVFALGISVLTAVYLRNDQHQDREAAGQMLATIGDLKLAQISNWREERFNDARFFAQADFVSRDVLMFLEHPLSGARNRLTHWLDLLKGGKRYALVALFDTNSVLRLALPEQTNANFIVSTPLMAEALRSNRVVMSDLYRSADDGDVHLEIAFPVAAPMSDSNLVFPRFPSPPIGVVLLRLDPHQFLYPFLQSWPIPSRTAETLLCRREGNEVVYLNELRHRTNSALKLRFPIAAHTNLPAVKAALGQSGEIEGWDYRGVPVLTSIRAVPDSIWFLVAKVDRDEIHAPLKQQAWLTLALTAVLAVVAGLVVGFAAKRREAHGALQRLALAQRVEHLLKHANDAILLADEQDHILEANDRALNLYGYSLAELQAMKLPALRAPETRSEFRRQAERMLDNGQAVFETVHQRKDGTVFPVEISSSLIEIGGVRYKLGFLRDITQRKAQAQEIERLSRLYATLSQVNQGITRVRSREKLFAEVCRIGVEFGGFKVVWVGCHDRQTHAVKILAHAGEGNGYLENIKISTEDSPEGRGLVGTRLRQGTPYISNDFINDERAAPWRAAAIAHGLRSVAAMPIRSDGEVCGAFTVYAGEPDVFQDKEIGLLEEMALDISFALDHLAEEGRRLQAEAALRESEAFTRTILDNLPVGIAVNSVSPAVAFLYMNDNFPRFYRTTREKLAGPDAFWNTVYEEPTFRETMRRRVLEDCASGNTERMYWADIPITRTGEITTFVTARNISLPEQGLMISTVWDVTTRKEAEAALQESEARLRYLSNNLPNCMIYQLQGHADGRRRFTYVSETVRRLHGCSPEEALADAGRIYACVVPEDQRLLIEAEEKVAVTLGVFNVEVRVRNPEGEIRWAQLVSSPRRMEDGLMIWDGIEIDITERKKAETVREAFLSLGTNLSAAKNPTEAARTIFATSDKLWRWDAGTLDISLPGSSQMQSVLLVDVLEGERTEIPQDGDYTESTPRFRRVMANGPELILRQADQLREPDSIRFGNTARLSASIMCAPLRSQGRPVGVLSIQSYTLDAFTQEDLRTLQAFADHCGGALERIQAEAAMRTSEEQFRAMFELASIGMAQADPQTGRLQRVNQKLCDITGYAAGELLQMRFSEFTHPDDRQKNWESFQLLVRGEFHDYRIEKRFLRKGGTVAWVNVNVSIIRDPAGKPVRTMATIEDITERKQAEESLRESERTLRRERALLRTLLDSIPDLIFFKDKNSVYLGCNEAFEHYSGLASSELIGKTDLELTAPEIAEGYRRKDREVLSASAPLVTEEWIPFHDGGGGMFETVKTHYRDGDGEVLGLIGISRDITDRKRMEQALHQRLELQNQLAQVAATVPGMIYSFRLRPDGSMSMPFASAALEEVFGLQLEQVCEDASPIMAMIHPDDLARVHESIAASARSMTPWRAEFQVRHTRKGELWLEGHSVPQLEADGSILWNGFVQDITERKRAEEALRKSESLFHSLVENLPLHVFRKDRDGRFLFGNGPFCEGLHTPLGEILGKTDFDFFPAELAAKYRNDDLRVIETGQPYEGEEAFQFAGGRMFVSILKTPLRDAKGQVTGIQGISWDITARKLAEEALRESEDRLKLALAASRMGVWEWDLRTNAVFWSPESYEIMGLNPQAGPLTLNHFTSLVHPEDRARVIASAEQAIANRTRFNAEFQLIRPDGGIRWLADDARASYDAEGRPLRLVGTVQDITARKLAEEQLRKLSRAMEQCPALVVITGTAGQIEYVNPKFTEVTGYSLEEVRGKSPRLLKSGETAPEDYRKLWQNILAGKEWRGEFHNRRKNGELYWESACISPILDAAGRITHFVGVKEDITERKRLEAQFRQAQKLEAIGQLAGGVAHDFNNILAATMMHLSLLQQTADLDAETRASLKELEIESQRAANLTRQLLMFSRRSVLQVKTLDLNEVVEHLLKMLRRLIGEQISIEWQGRSQLPAVSADAGMLEQVIMNLVVNARDAMPNGGRITLATRHIMLEDEDARAMPEARPGSYVCLAVADSGCGMDEMTLKRIFEPFFTTKEAGKGTGLGLATVYGIASQHQGWVTVESRVGVGSTFRVFLPALAGGLSDATVQPQSQPLRGGNETILLVEDEHSVRKTVGSFLLKCGYRVIEAANGMEALGLWTAHGPKIDLLFTDMVMPGGINGLRLAQKLRGAKADLKVLITSGYSAELVAQSDLAHKGLHFVAKPCPASDLAVAIRRCLDTPRDLPPP